MQWITLLIGFIPFVIGYIGNYLPFFIAHHTGAKIKYIEDRLSIAMATGIGVYLIYFVILLGVAAYINDPIALGFVLILPFLGYFSLLYKEYYQECKAQNALRKVDKHAIQNLKEQRLELQTLVK